MPRYSVIAFLLTLVAVLVLARAGYIMTAKKDYWMAVAKRVRQDSVRTQPTRGNILACDGQLLASSLPEFKIYMDFKQLHDAGTDSLWNVKLDSICLGLHRIFRWSTLKRGFHGEQLNARENPYGSLAKRTIGDVLLTEENGRAARYGLELSYDSLLKGSYGIVSRQKVLGKFLSITDTPPITASDMGTTIDGGMQD